MSNKKSTSIFQETIRTRTSSWTKFKETESSKRMCGFIRSYQQRQQVKQVLLPWHVHRLRLGDLEDFPSPIGYVIPPVCSGLVGERGWRGFSSELRVQSSAEMSGIHANQTSKITSTEVHSDCPPCTNIVCICSTVVRLL